MICGKRNRKITRTATPKMMGMPQKGRESCGRLVFGEEVVEFVAATELTIDKRVAVKAKIVRREICMTAILLMTESSCSRGGVIFNKILTSCHLSYHLIEICLISRRTTLDLLPHDSNLICEDPACSGDR